MTWSSAVPGYDGPYEASQPLALLQTLRRHADRFRRPIFTNGLDGFDDIQARSDSARSRLFDYRERFETQLLILVGKQPTPDFFDCLPLEEAQGLQKAFATLFRHLDEIINDDFRVEHVPPLPRASTIKAQADYPRLNHVLALLNATRRPVDICGDDNFCLFRLVTLKEANDAYTLVAKVNQLLQNTLHSKSAHSTSTSSRSKLHAQEDVDQWIHSFGLTSERRLGCLLDTIKADFDNCKISANNAAHDVRVQLLNYGTRDTDISENWSVCLFCPGMGGWHVGKCEFETEISEPYEGSTQLCHYIRRSQHLQEGLALRLHENSNFFSPHSDVLDHMYGPSSTTLKEMIQDEHAFDLPAYGACFSNGERRVLAAKLALHLSIFCPWRHASFPWDSELIHFLRSDVGQVDRNTPFIVWQLGHDSSAAMTPREHPESEKYEEEKETIAERLAKAFTLFAKLLLEIEYGDMSRSKVMLNGNNLGNNLRTYHADLKATADPITGQGYLEAVSACFRFHRSYENERLRQRTSLRLDKPETPEATYRRLVRTQITAKLLVGLVNFETVPIQAHSERSTETMELDLLSDSDYELIEDDEILQYHDSVVEPVTSTKSNRITQIAHNALLRPWNTKMGARSTAGESVRKSPDPFSSSRVVNQKLSMNNYMPSFLHNITRPNKWSANPSSLSASSHDLPSINTSDHSIESESSSLRQSSVISLDGHLFGTATDTDPLRAQQRGTDKWFNNFLALLKNLQIGEVSGRPLKIAILDSGFNQEDAEFNNDERSRIKAIHSFADDDSDMDTVGHGTFVATIILRLTVNVDLYIAKITNLHRPSKKATVNAMRHARTEWDVDIISLSSGFEQVTPTDGLQHEVESCLQHKIIIFASACNDGAEGSRTYPAKFPGVISVHSSDYQGMSSRFNPLPHEKGDMSFIGEAIRPVWGRSDLKKSSKTDYQSGTSYATPVAAAFGAFMIGYVQSRGWEEWKWMYAPWTPLGMVWTLRMMSAPTEVYRWVSPTKFFKSTDSDTIEVMIKERLVRGRPDNII